MPRASGVEGTRTSCVSDAADDGDAADADDDDARTVYCNTMGSLTIISQSDPSRQSSWTPNASRLASSTTEGSSGVCQAASRRPLGLAPLLISLHSSNHKDPSNYDDERSSRPDFRYVRRRFRASHFENSTVPFALISRSLSATGAAILPLRRYICSITGDRSTIRLDDGRIRDPLLLIHATYPSIRSRSRTHNHPRQQALSPSPSPPRAPNGRITISRRGTRSATAVRSI